MTVCKSLILTLMILSFAAVTAHADHVSQEWDEGSTGSWLHVTSAGVVEVSPTGGLTGGYLSTYEPTYTYGIVGAINFQPDYTGDYSLHAFRRLQVAVRLMGGTFLKVYAHLRYLDAMHNGWQCPLNVDFGSSEWQIFNLDFDPDWTDQQALDAGWVQETAAAPFAATMAHVYTVGIKGEGTGTLSLGLDHFALQDAATSEESMTWGDIKSLYR